MCRSVGVFFFLFFLTVVHADCPDGWVQYQEKCYHFSDFAVTFPDASSFCKASNAKLAEPQTDDENKYLQQMTKQKGTRFYIGVVDYFVEGSWVFVSRIMPAATPFWAPGEPNNHGNEDCVEILPDSGMWADCSCSLTRNFICETDVGFSGMVIGKK